MFSRISFTKVFDVLFGEKADFFESRKQSDIIAIAHREMEAKEPLPNLGARLDESAQKCLVATLDHWLDIREVMPIERGTQA